MINDPALKSERSQVPKTSVSPHPRSKDCREGFSLLEVVMALAILAIASIPVLETVRGLIDLALRVRGYHESTRSLLNDAAVLAAHDKRRLIVKQGHDRVEILVRDNANFHAQVENVVLGQFGAPISLGFAPIQVYTIFGSRDRTLLLVTDGLPVSQSYR